MYTRSSKDAEAEGGLSVSNGKDLIEAIKDGFVNIRLMADLYAGPVISVGAAYTIPTNFTISQGNWRNFFQILKLWKTDKFLCVFR